MATLDYLIEIARGISRCSGISSGSAINQDLGIAGDDAEEFIAALAAAYGEWVIGLPWAEFVDLNEPPARWGPRIWKFLSLPEVSRAFPGYTERRLELGHIAKVIDAGHWLEP